MTTAVSRREAAYGLSVLTLINGVNYLDRYILSGVMGQVEATFHVSHDVAGLLQTVFMVVYMAAGLIGGRLGDTGSRRLLISASIFIWSLATFGSGLAPTLLLLFIARGLTGFGEAGYATTAPAVISDLYPPERRSSRLAVFYLAMPVGSALGFAIGGWVGERYSWHHAFYVGGTLGVGLGLLALFMPEPQRGASDGRAVAKVSLSAGLKKLVPNRIFWTCTAGLTLMTFSIGGLALWMPSFLHLERGFKESTASIGVGAVTALAGLLGTLAGGYLSERAERRSPTGGLWISGLGLLLAAPCMVLAAYARGPAAIFGTLFVGLFLLFLNTGPLNAAICTFVPANFRAFAMGLSVCVLHLLGDAISPPIIGALGRHESFQFAIAVNALPVALGGVVLMTGSLLLHGSASQVLAGD